ncbi:MAG: GspH/FimT family protein [Pseudomonadota bacterium]|nr:GspH/FimT family protein [Pseudomonadota bacterium]
MAEALQNGVRLAQNEAVRRNQQVVLSLTNAQPALNSAAVANGKNWSIQTVAQFGKAAEYVQGGALADVASGVAITGPASICFNSNGRLVLNATPGVSGAACDGGAANYFVSHASSDRPLRVIVAIAGQLRMCDPNRPAPDGCPLS